ncbi:unnamed protein product [Ectocarpus sp. CCAP 1310/34]|nr:unnamed protein product [Ectocarpus sp. CCAP 1310/34]
MTSAGGGVSSPRDSPLRPAAAILAANPVSGTNRDRASMTVPNFSVIMLSIFAVAWSMAVALCWYALVV